MKKILFTLSILVGAFTISFAQSEDDFRESCTSIMVGKKASTDGSIITSHTCDGRYRTWVKMTPSQTFSKGDKIPIFKGALFTETDTDTVGLKQVGEIPMIAEKSYVFYNTAYPCMNEKNLAMGETTTVGRKSLQNENAMFLIEELQRLALQYCTTAREAILLIGKLAQEYGFADEGECLTIIDKNEVWHFEIHGIGKDEIGAVWAAQRIPDDHVGVSANMVRIGELHLDNTDYYMASDNVFDVAKRLGHWDGVEPFKFWKAYNDDGKKPFAIREWFILSTLAPSLNLSMNDAELPFSVKPEKLVSPRDVLALFRSTYEGTEHDMTKNLLVSKKKTDSDETEIVKSPYANPWMTRDMVDLLNAGKDSTVVRVRPIAVPQCAYATVIQIRDWLPDEIACVAYVANDNPGQSPRFPVYAQSLRTPEKFHISGHRKYSEESAAWIYRRANKLASIRWQTLREKIENPRDEFENKLFDEQAKIESEAAEILKTKGSAACREYLTKYGNDFIQQTLDAWWKLGDALWHEFIRGI